MDGLIGLGWLIIGMISMVLAFYVIALVFTHQWHVDETGRFIAGVIGFFFGIGLNCAYFDKPKK